MVIYFILDGDGYPDTSSTEPIVGAQTGNETVVTEHANNYHRQGKPARYQRDDPPGHEQAPQGEQHNTNPKKRNPR